MDNTITEAVVRRINTLRPSKPGVKAWAGALVGLGLVASGVILGPHLLSSTALQTVAAAPPVVEVSTPLQRDVDTRLQFLGSSRPSIKWSSGHRSAAR